MKLPRTAASVLAAAGVVLSLTASADPRPGARMPWFRGTDLNGRVHDTNELRQPTIVLAVTSGDARGAAAAWMRAASGRFRGSNVRIVTVVAISVPFFVSDGFVRDRARPETPRDQWGATWLDVHGDVQRRLGIRDGSNAPWVIALDANGRVLSSVHGAMNEAHAQAVFNSIPQS